MLVEKKMYIIVDSHLYLFIYIYISWTKKYEQPSLNLNYKRYTQNSHCFPRIIITKYKSILYLKYKKIIKKFNPKLQNAQIPHNLCYLKNLLAQLIIVQLLHHVVSKWRNSADDINPFPSLSKCRKPSLKSSAFYAVVQTSLHLIRYDFRNTYRLAHCAIVSLFKNITFSRFTTLLNSKYVQELRKLLYHCTDKVDKDNRGPIIGQRTINCISPISPLFCCFGQA
ncbi:hypothetical protein AGLY_005400 [Aphis glycines]|uniref:Uncharacterized protein n=1 Tax=Aphis glycines TaxID=307491 RepID=A0A6G0TTW7_APHGL|nr:hypothetical protein AGLY_005400 [Aphis glycines]